MISLMGIRRDIPIQIREAFTIKKKRKNEILIWREALKLSCRI